MGSAAQRRVHRYRGPGLGSEDTLEAFAASLETDGFALGASTSLNRRTGVFSLTCTIEATSAGEAARWSVGPFVDALEAAGIGEDRARIDRIGVERIDRGA